MVGKSWPWVRPSIRPQPCEFLASALSRELDRHNFFRDNMSLDDYNDNDKDDNFFLNQVSGLIGLVS